MQKINGKNHKNGTSKICRFFNFLRKKMSIKNARLILKAKNFLRVPVCGYILLIGSNGDEHKKTRYRRKMKAFNFFMLFLCRA